MNAIAATTTPKRRRSRKVPEALIYEIVDGRPVYYKGYRDVLNGKLKLEEIMPDSSLQSWLKAQLTILLGNLLAGKSELMTGELGLFTDNKSRRGADIAFYKIGQVVLDAHYSRIPPELIIEIDIQAEMEGEDEMDYIAGKIEDYHRFGVKKVIWIFTSIQKVTVAAAGKPWVTYAWNENIETIEGATFNLEQLLKGRKIS